MCSIILTPFTTHRLEPDDTWVVQCVCVWSSHTTSHYIQLLSLTEIGPYAKSMKTDPVNKYDSVLSHNRLVELASIESERVD